MPTHPPSQRRQVSRGLLNLYSVRLMLGLVLSLGALVFAFRLPVLHHLPDGVGWGPRATAPPLALQDVREARDRAASQAGGPASSFEALLDGQAGPERGEGADASGGDAPSGADDASSANAPRERSEEDPSRVTETAALHTLDRAPQVVGGVGDLYLRIGYPLAARRDSIQGRLFLNFIVEKDGSTSRVRVTRSLHPLCDSAAVRAVERTRFMPGRRNGERVRVAMQLPVRFKLRSRASPLRTERASEEGESTNR